MRMATACGPYWLVYVGRTRNVPSRGSRLPSEPWVAPDVGAGAGGEGRPQPPGRPLLARLDCDAAGANNPRGPRKTFAWARAHPVERAFHVPPCLRKGGPA